MVNSILLNLEFVFKSLKTINTSNTVEVQQIEPNYQGKKMIKIISARSLEKIETKNDMIKYYTFPLLGFPEETQPDLHKIQSLYFKDYTNKLAENEKAWRTISKISNNSISKIKNILHTFGCLPSKRPKLWMTLSKAEEKMKGNPNLYSELSKKKFPKDMDESQMKMMNSQIHSTFIDHPLFDELSPIFETMKRIIIALSWNISNFKYVREVNDILGIILIHLSEEESFWLMKILIEDVLPKEFFHPSYVTIQQESMLLNQFIDRLVPNISNHFKILNIDFGSTFKSCLCEIYVKHLPISVILIILNI